MNAIEQLEYHLQLLLDQYVEQEKQLADLQQTNKHLREELIQTHTELGALQKQFNSLQTAYGLISEESDARTRAKQQLTYLISEIDQALEELK